MIGIICQRLRDTSFGLILLGLLTVTSQAQIGFPPVIAVQPVSITVPNGGTAVVTATAVSLTSMTLTWRFNGQPLATNATATVLNIAVPGVGTVSTLTVSNVIPANAGNYSLRVVNGVGAVTSSDAAVSVTDGISLDQVSSTNTGGTSVASLVWPHTVGNGAYAFLLVSVATHSGVAVSGITYGGAALTPIGSVVNAKGTHVGTEMWYLRSPSPGTSNVVVTLSGKDVFAAGAASFFGVNLSQPFGPFTSATGKADTPSITAASAAGEVVIDSVSAHAATSGASGTGQTLLWKQFTGDSVGNVWGSCSFEAGAATVPMSWTLSGTGAGEWAAGAVALQPAAHNAVYNTAAGMTPKGFACQFFGPTSSTYVVLTSTNCRAWSPVATNVILSGAFPFTDSTATNHPLQFYRVLVQ